MKKKIITIPNPVLRKISQPVRVVDKKVRTLANDLIETLIKKTNPKGVGLAAPQINTSLRVFCTRVDLKKQPTVYCNPTITAQSKKLTFGPDSKEPIMEGCLSMPRLYGAVPRFEWIEIAYDHIVDDQLIHTEDKLTEYEARVFQHELDHLDGILFTDHSLKYGLPVFTEEGEDWIEVDPSIIAAI